MKTIFNLLMLLLIGFCLTACNKSEQGKNKVYDYFLQAKRTETTVVLRWDMGGCGGMYACPELAPDRFEIQMSKNNMNKFVSIETIPSTDSTFTVTNLEKGTSYYFKLLAKNGKSKKSSSNIINIIPDVNPVITKTISNKAVNISDVSWVSNQNMVAYAAKMDEHGNQLNEGARYSVFIESLNAGLTFVEEDAWSPRFSPDGQTLVYATENNVPRFSSDIVLYNINTKIKTKLVTNFGFAYAPYWSADGEWVSFLFNDVESKELYFYKIHKNGGQPIRISDNLKDVIYSGYSIGAVAWAADNSSIIFDMPSMSKKAYYQKTIVSMLLNGGNFSFIELNSIWNDFSPSFSPDGKYLAFISQRASAYDIWLKDLKTNELKQLSSMPDVFISPITNINWSADSKEIMFVGNSSLVKLTLP